MPFPIQSRQRCCWYIANSIALWLFHDIPNSKICRRQNGHRYEHVYPETLNKSHATSQLQVGPRVHFKLQPQQSIPEKKKSPPSSLINGNGKSLRPTFAPGLKRSKSLTSADALASGMAALGLAADAGDLGTFPAEIQDCIDKALEGKCSTLYVEQA